MSYDAVIEQVKSVPEEYLDDISRYIRLILNGNARQNVDQKKNGKFEKYFGTMDLGDGLAIQKQMRGEWAY